jgi:propanol-preferring alcohol dehydrogenase
MQLNTITTRLLASWRECQKMLKVVFKDSIIVKTDPFNGIDEISKAIELAHSQKMQGKPVGHINQKSSRMRIIQTQI